MTDYPSDLGNSRGASERYWAIRDAQLTQKFTLQDYGFTALVLFIALGFLQLTYGMRTLRDIAAVRTPTKRWKIFALGFAAAFTSTVAYILSLFIDASRDAFPPWADSLGIPLAGVPFFFTLMAAIALCFALAGSRHYIPAQLVCNAFVRGTRPAPLALVVLGIPFVFSGVFVVLTIVAGDFVNVAPILLWFGFFTFILSAHQKPANRALQPTVTSGLRPPAPAAERER